MKLRTWLSFSSVALAIAACGLVIDPDTLVSGAGGDAGPDATTGDGRPIDPNCKSTGKEICDDGIDNDCNGDIDCADPACNAGFACVDGTPEGWTELALADTARPPCPSGYTGSADVRVVQGDGAHSCKCDCAGACTGSITVAKGTDATCASGTETFTQNTNGNCTAKNVDLSAFAALTTPTAGACTPNDVATKSSPTNGRTCVPPPRKGGGGCTGTQRCLQKPAGFALCVAKPGNVECPAVFTKQRRTGTNAADPRACTGCSCTSSGACSSEVDFWTQPNCNGTVDAKLTTAANGACGPASALNNARAYKSRTVSGCVELTPSIAGGVISFENEQTICCR
jgi:hypothetical protein